jgi:holliday junction DNA helicase RuvA
MIERVTGKILEVGERFVVVNTGSVGLMCMTPRPQLIPTGETTTLLTYLHWNQEKGPALFGFVDELERTLFLMLISCPKIGPSIALNILAQLDAAACAQTIRAGDTRALSKLNGIGAKKAAQIVTDLQDKIAKLPAMYFTGATTQSSTMAQVAEALSSLGYTTQEISGAIKALDTKLDPRSVSGTSKEQPFEQLLRSALGTLAQGPK